MNLNEFNRPTAICEALQSVIMEFLRKLSHFLCSHLPRTILLIPFSLFSWNDFNIWIKLYSLDL